MYKKASKKTKEEGFITTTGEKSQARAENPESDINVPDIQEATAGQDTQVEDMQEAQACARRGETQSEQTAKKGRRVVVTFTEEQKMMTVDTLTDNKLIYNKSLMDYKDPMKRDVLWDEICLMSQLEKEAYKKWF